MLDVTSKFLQSVLCMNVFNYVGVSSSYLIITLSVWPGIHKYLQHMFYSIYMQGIT